MSPQVCGAYLFGLRDPAAVRDDAAARTLLAAHPLIAEDGDRLFAVTAGEAGALPPDMGLAGTLVPSGSGRVKAV